MDRITAKIMPELVFTGQVDLHLARINKFAIEYLIPATYVAVYNYILLVCLL